jgi:putative ABC transport system permease protein
MAWYRRFTNLLRSDRHSRELDREMGFHLAERVDELIARGMPEAEARREARRRFGNRGVMKERTRDADILAWLDALLADLRQAMRALRSNPGFALVAVLSLGLGIGANTAIFSLINAVMLKSLPVSHPETLLKVTMGKGDDVFTNPIWEQVRGHPEVFSGAFAYSQDRFNLAQGGEARRVEGEWVSGDYFATLGVHAMLGRTIAHADDVRGCPAIAVLGYGLWQSEFGGVDGAIGRTLSINSHSYQVVGVVDRAFFGVDVGRRAQLYLPICSEAVIDGPQNAIDDRSSWWLSVMARPAAGASAAQTGARLAALAPGVYQATVPPHSPADRTERYLKRTLEVTPAANGFSELRLQYLGALRVLMVVVALVLLIACANVANLLLARATVRQHEAAIRLALGAGRGRLIRLMLTEAMLLSLVGAALGVLFASWGTRVLTSFLSVRGSTAWLDLAIDRRVLAFTTLAALISGVFFGLAPAWRSAQADPQAALKAQGRSVVGRSRRRLAWTLVAGQVALSFVLLTSAGLLLGSFRNLLSNNAGFRRDGILLVQTSLTDTNSALPTTILERVRALPGVRSASFSSMTPLSNSGMNTFILADGYQPANKRDALSWVNDISEDYFTTMGTTLIGGRDVGPGDNAGSPQVALITQSVARRVFGSANPIGRQFRTPEGDHDSDPIEVIGVVEDTKFGSIRDTAGMVIYVPMAQASVSPRYFTIELRSNVAPTALIAGVKSVMAELSPTASLQFTTLSDQVARSLSRDRLLATLATFFGGLALLLALIGLYGTMAYNVARRQNEIGIRIALGAARERVIRMVIGEVGVVVVAGLGIGVLLALAATRLVASFLFGLSASDPVTWIGSAGVLLCVALLAGAAPAWRAARMNPMTALREE